MLLKWKPATQLDKNGLKIIKLLKTAGFEAFFVGGAVRDVLLNKRSDNLDIATSARPERIEKILNSAGIKYKLVGKKFGTVLAITNHGPIEITTFRAEGRYSDRRHPDKVEFIGDYAKDAQRRDFTINALFYDPLARRILDPVNGQKDLKAKIIRFVGDPKKRIDEDALRMLRGVRLAGQLGFKLEKNSFAAIKTRAKYIQHISGERIKAELDKILLSPNPGSGLRLLDEVGLLKFIIPEMEALKTFFHKSKQYHLEGSMFEHTLLAVNCAKGRQLDLLYALLFHDIGKPLTAMKALKPEGWVISSRGHSDVSGDIFNQFAKRLKFPRVNSQNVEWLIRNHMLFADFYTMHLEKQVKLAQHPVFKLLVEHWQCDESANKRIKYLDEYHKKYLKSKHAAETLFFKLAGLKNEFQKLTNGNLIMSFSKISSGPKVGKLQTEIRLKIIRGEIKNLFDVKNFLKKIAKGT